MRRSSKVFDTMLFGCFRESQQGPDWTVELPEDDSWAMQILLNAVHANFSEVPRKMDISGLYRITVLTNKYDMTHCLQPWASIWASEADKPALHSPINWDLSAVEKTKLEMIWVLHEFGMYSPFETRVLETALNATATPDGDIQIQVTGLDGDSRKTRMSKLEDAETLIDGKVLGQFNIFPFGR